MGFLSRFFGKNEGTKKINISGLIRNLNSTDSKVWIPAAKSLAATGDSRAVDPLFRKLQHYNDNNDHLFLALGAFKEEDVAKKIISFKASAPYKWPYDFLKAAKTALVSIGEPAIGPVSEEIEKPEEESVFGHNACMEVLRDIGSPSALPAVKDTYSGSWTTAFMSPTTEKPMPLSSL